MPEFQPMSKASSSTCSCDGNASFSTFHDGKRHLRIASGELKNLEWKSTHHGDVCESELFTVVFEAFEKFKEDVECGEHGQTAQFWTMYIRYIQVYHFLERSIRETDIDLFVSSMAVITDLFFATNRQNYARWMSKYQLDLLNIDNTHPGLRQLLQEGGFSVRRTNNEFSRIPIDLTLEQTINADAASRLTGYTSSTNNFNSRLRWSITKSSRAAMLNEALSMVGMGNAQHNVKNLVSHARVKRDNADLENVISQIELCANPFTLDRSVPLINISTGKCASDSVASSLLSVPEEGKERHQSFVTECISDLDRFEKPIKRCQLHTFASDCIGNKKVDKNSKEAQLKCTSQLLGRIAFTAASADIDLEYIFSFPLTPVPLTLCRGDGTMVRTDKSKLLSMLEDTLDYHGNPTAVRTHIIDGNFLLHCMSPDQPITYMYGDLSKNILMACLAYNSPRIDVCFDTYERPSIKDSERLRRTGKTEEKEIVIDGPLQKRDASFKKLLERESFKRNLLVFLRKDWSRGE